MKWTRGKILAVGIFFNEAVGRRENKWEEQ